MSFRYFLPFCRLPFYFVNGFLYCAEAFCFDVIPLIYFCLCSLCFWCQVQNIIAKTDVKKLTACFFLGLLRFQVLYSNLSFIELIFMCAVCFHYSHVAVQFAQHRLWHRLSFPHWMFLTPSLLSQFTVYAWVYFWALYSVPLICVCYWCQFHTVLITIVL